MPSSQHNLKNGQDSLNVLILDASASMMGSGPKDKSSPLADGLKVASGVRHSETLILTASNKGGYPLEASETAFVEYGATPGLNAAQDVLEHIKGVQGRGQRVNIVYFTDENPQDPCVDAKDFLLPLKEYGLSVHVLTLSADHQYFEDSYPIEAKEKEDDLSYTIIPKGTDPLFISDMVLETWRKQAQLSKQTANLSADRNLTSKAHASLMETRDQITFEIARKTDAAEQLKAEIEQKMKMLAEQKSDICTDKRQLAKIDAAIKVVNKKPLSALSR